MKRHKSLKVKCLKFVAISVVTISVIFSVGSVFHEKEELEERLDRNIKLTMAITAKALENPMWDFDTAAMESHLSSFEENPDFCGAVVTDKQGGTLAKTKSPLNHDNSLIVKKEIIYDNQGTKENLGLLTLCYSTKHISAAMIEAAWTTFTIAAVVLALILYSVFYSVNIITKPLDAIRKALGNVAENMAKIEDPELNQDNEIGEVTSAFNVMIDDLVQSRSELITAKEKAEEANRLKSEFLANVSMSYVPRLTVCWYWLRI